jgi:ribose transport system ATP-binding protein
MFPGHGVRPSDFLEDLPLSRRQMLECASVFVGAADEQSLFLMDEPTSALSDEDSAAFYRYISAHATSTGSSFLITTHRLLEMTSHMARVVVLRDGAVSTEVGAGAQRDELTRAMGRITTEDTPASAQERTPRHVAGSAGSGEAAQVVARVTQDAREGEPESVELRLGEVIGLAGLEGHGQGDCLVAFFTASRRRLGRRARTAHLKVETRVDAAYVSGDRRRRGVLPLWSVRDNLALASIRRLRRGPVVSTAAAQDLYDDWAQRLSVKGAAEANILALSGGNQQKVLLARALATGAPMVALDDPTRGVDQSTKEAMYELLRNEAAAGKCVVWFSTENDELRQCDRVLVFRNGRIAAELSGDSLTEDLVIQHSFQGEVAS